MIDYSLSAEAEDLLGYLFKHKGQCPVVFDDEVVRETIRAGLIERVTISADDAFVVLTRSGEEWCRSSAPDARPITPSWVLSSSK